MIDYEKDQEQHRHKCEVDYILNMKTKHQRREYLRGVEEKRGKGAAFRLRSDVTIEFRKRKNK